MSFQFRPRVESLDSRDLPSTTVLTPTTYQMTGSSGNLDVTVSVVADNLGSGDKYYWTYDVHQSSSNGFGAGSPPMSPMPGMPPPPPPTYSPSNTSMMLVFEPSSNASSPGATLDGTITSMSASSGTGSWQAHHAGQAGILTGSTYEYTFATDPVDINQGTATFSDDAVGGAGGQVAAPGVPSWATMDFSGVTTGKTYGIHVECAYKAGSFIIRSSTDVSIGPAATVDDIRDAVKTALSGAGLTVESIGTTKLKISMQETKLTELSFTTFTRRDSNGNPIIDATILGPTLATASVTSVNVNGQNLTP